MAKPRILILASGTETGGGTGYYNLVEHTRKKDGELHAEVVAVVSNHERGGVRNRAEFTKVPFRYFDPIGLTAAEAAAGYTRIAEEFEAEWFVSSGWLRRIYGLPPERTINIHPALLSVLHGRFGGLGMHGDHVHKTSAQAILAGAIDGSGLTMHFVTSEYDRGPIFFEKKKLFKKGTPWEDIRTAVHRIEHKWQPRITNMVVHGEISWTGTEGDSVRVPPGYPYLPQVLGRGLR